MLATTMILAVGWPTMYGTKEAKATWHYIFGLHQSTRIKLQYSYFKIRPSFFSLILFLSGRLLEKTYKHIQKRRSIGQLNYNIHAGKLNGCKYIQVLCFAFFFLHKK